MKDKNNYVKKDEKNNLKKKCWGIYGGNLCDGVFFLTCECNDSEDSAIYSPGAQEITQVSKIPCMQRICCQRRSLQLLLCVFWQKKDKNKSCHHTILVHAIRTLVKPYNIIVFSSSFAQSFLVGHFNL